MAIETNRPLLEPQTQFAQNFGTVIGRILMRALFIWSGYGKLVSPAATQAYFTSLGVPLPALAWLAALVVELVG
jgi:putative oxidoreductase